jgi:threonylcarbamoyladenosine tRNA methylthiotransferase MtaB
MDLKNLKIAFYTLGCKVNIYETGVMENDVVSLGAELVPFTEKADVYVVNTCSVTNMADRKSRQILHRAKKENPEAVIVAAGCYSETGGEEALSQTGADLVIGNELKKSFASVLASYLEKGTVPVNPEIGKVQGYGTETLRTLPVRTRADVKVQDGCNQFCTYCVIPYARGRIRSKALPEAVEEIRVLAGTGVQEIVLTGIHLSSYGKDLVGPETSLLDLIKAVHEIPEVKRIRLGSLEPRIVTEDFAQALASLPKLCPHFHLSLQSGSATVLKRMNRHYTPAEYAEGVALLRRYFKHPAITTDVIAGFPGETEEEFRETLSFAEQIGFYEMHVFQYSRRKGTVADRMKDQVLEPVKKLRSEALIALRERMSEAFEQSLEGETVEVLTEEKAEEKGFLSGYTKEYVRVLVPNAVGENRIVRGVLRRENGKNRLEVTDGEAEHL